MQSLFRSAQRKTPAALALGKVASRMRRRRRDDWWLDAAAGAVGGLMASWVMGKAMHRINQLGPDRALFRERIATESAGEPPTQKVAEMATRPLGIRLSERQKAAGGQIVHYAYGTAWGAAAGMLAPRVPLRPVLYGAAFGAALWLLSDEILLPALRLTPRARHFPASYHMKALASHVVYGVVAGTSARALRDAAASRMA